MRRRAAAAASAALSRRQSRSALAAAAAAAAAEQQRQEEQDEGDGAQSAAEDDGDAIDNDGGATPVTNTPGADTPADADDAEESTNERVASTSAPSGPRPKFVLVSDHGQSTLVPISKAHNYRSMTGREGEQPQQNEEESGASTPVARPKKKLIRVQIKRGRGRPPKKAVKPRYEFIEEDEEEEDEEEEDGGAATPMDDDGSAPPDDGGGTTTGPDEENPAGVEIDVFIEGKQYIMKNDEVILDGDEAGDKKIDEKGALLGGREFSFPIFQSPQRPDPTVWYALSIDAAKGAGYTSSFFFYRRNPLLIKVACTYKEKEWCIEHGRLPAHLRTRSVNMVAVRNVFKLHGAKVIKNGRYVTDDYYEKAARESGKVDGQPVDVPSLAEEDYGAGGTTGTRTSERRQRELERERDRSRRRPDAFTYAATDLHGNPWFTTFGDTGEAPFERAKAWPTRRVNALRTELSEDNWMMEMAASVRGMNRELLVGRLERLRAFGRPYEAIEGVPEEDEVETAPAPAAAPPQVPVTEPVTDAPQEQTEKPQGESGAEKVNGGEGEAAAPAAPAETTAAPTTATTEAAPVQAPSKKRKAASTYLPIGLYEPLTNLPHYSTLTQSRWATFERLEERPLLPQQQQRGTVSGGATQVKQETDGDTAMSGVNGDTLNGDRNASSQGNVDETRHPAAPKRAVLGGSVVGGHAWGIASIEQRVTLPLPRANHDIRLAAGASSYEMEM